MLFSIVHIYIEDCLRNEEKCVNVKNDCRRLGNLASQLNICVAV